jgi:CRP-like cAMP-binding protein
VGRVRATKRRPRQEKGWPGRRLSLNWAGGRHRVGEWEAMAARGPAAATAEFQNAAEGLFRAGKRRSFARGDKLLRPGSSTECQLLLAGLASIRFGAPPIEVDLLGPGSLINIGVLLKTNENEHLAVALTECETLALPSRALAEALSQRQGLDALIMRYVQERMVQSMRAASCHLNHATDQRLASWLAVATQLIGASELRITHQALATLLGVRRPTVTLALQTLEGEQAIWSKRGRIIVRDRDILLARSCGCAESRMDGRRLRARQMLR